MIKVYKPLRTMFISQKNETKNEDPQKAMIRAIEDFPSKDAILIGSDLSSKLFLYNTLKGNKECRVLFF